MIEKLLYTGVGFILGTKKGREMALDGMKKIGQYAEKKLKKTPFGEVIDDIFNDKEDKDEL